MSASEQYTVGEDRITERSLALTLFPLLISVFRLKCTENDSTLLEIYFKPNDDGMLSEMYLFERRLRKAAR